MLIVSAMRLPKADMDSAVLDCGFAEVRRQLDADRFYPQASPGILTALIGSSRMQWRS
jgi:hypothetical protein